MSAIQPRYPVYVPSKGRAEKALTIRFMQRDKLPFRVVVEPQEAEAYAKIVRPEQLLVLPFSNLGMGSTPARNWIRDHAEAEGHARHWQFDDNIESVWRAHRRHRVRCQAGPALAAVEDFSDRYTNMGVSGLNYVMFAPVETTRVKPLAFNVHVYSATLVNHEMPCRWRCLYNEDTDLCLQALANGWCTALVSAFLVQKLKTMIVKGGNTAELYAGDGRLMMARSLERLWPGVVRVDRRFGRPQHVVDWKRFRGDPKPELKPGIDLDALPPADYGLKLRAVGEVRSDRLKRLLAEDSAS